MSDSVSIGNVSEVEVTKIEAIPATDEHSKELGQRAIIIKTNSGQKIFIFLTGVDVTIRREDQKDISI